jgi:hypothetical protein
LDIPKKKNEACYESYILYINQMLNQNYPVLFVCLLAFCIRKVAAKTWEQVAVVVVGV